MKKLLILTMAFMFMLSSMAFATETRVMTMGNNNMILLDDANTSIFPGRVLEYPNLAIGEFSSNDFNSFGINWKFGSSSKPWVLGTYFSTMATMEPNDYQGNGIVSWDLTRENNRRIDLFYGRGMGNSNFGLNLTLAHSSQSREFTSDQQDESFALYDFNFGLSGLNGDWDVAAGIAFGSITDKDAAGKAETEGDGYYDFTASARFFHNYNPTYTFVPHVSVAIGSHGTKATADTTSYDRTAFDIGVGMNYEPATNVLAVLDFGFQYHKITTESATGAGTTSMDQSDFSIPYFKLGLDADIFKWLDFRAGATSFWTNSKMDAILGAESGQFKSNSASNETFLGFGFHWNRLHVDTYANPALFLDGFNFISGSTNDMNFQISVLYEMM